MRGTGTTFFDPATGAITIRDSAAGIIGETVRSDFQLRGVSRLHATAWPPSAGPGPGGQTLHYYPALISTTGNACPSSCGGGTDFERNIECCNPTPISCGTTATAPAVYQMELDTTVFPEGAGGPAQNGVECLIHQRPGNGMDILDYLL